LAEVGKEDLKQLQKNHLEFLEGGHLNRFVVAGVPILQCFNYKTIQVVNNLGLKAILESPKEAKRNG
jgi:hypothetical protein